MGLYNYVVNLKRRIKTYMCKRNIKKTAKKVKGKLTVGGPSNVNENTILGKNVNFNGFKVRGDGRLVIGDNFHSGPGILLITRVHNYKGEKIPYDETYIKKPIHIEDNVWIGARVIIVGEVKIGEGAIIQAGSVVVDDIPSCAIAGGHPAEVFEYRDKKHYKKLKKKKKYH